MARAAHAAWTMIGTLTVVVLAGCIADEPAPPAPPTVGDLASIVVYEYRYPGDDVSVHGFPYGWMARLSNPTATAQNVSVTPHGAATAGPVDAEMGWDAGQDLVTIAPGEARLFLFQDADPHGTNGTGEAGFDVAVLDAAGTARERGTFVRTLEWLDEGIELWPGDRIIGKTVGVWLNGTSFYTNIPELDADANFSAGYERDGFSDAPLTVYVWDQAASENPPGNRDNCWFSTITGFNRLLRTIGAGSTNAMFVAPEDAYTLPGRDTHPLFGDALVFMTTVTSLDSRTATEDTAPDPQGGCFDWRNTFQYLVPSNSLPIPPIL